MQVKGLECVTFSAYQLAHDWWGMTYDFNVYVSMFWVTLGDLLVGCIGINKK
jgi:hypothetical protein